LCDYAYNLATAFSAFYRDHHILSEQDVARRASYLGLVATFLKTIVTVLDLLGIEVPERM
jgi:arginyl-tRNA synthetase